MSEESKFKVGDKVWITSIPSNVSEVDAEVGNVGSIIKVDDSSIPYKVKSDSFTNDQNGIWFREENLELVVEQQGVKYDSDKLEPIVSDGGSSDYYFTTLPKHLIDQIIETGGIEIKDIARYIYDNDADAFNIIKAQKRIIEARKGKGKAGIDLLYDANKIKFFASEQYEAIKQEGSL